MAKKPSFPRPTAEETAWGFGYLAVQQIALPSLLKSVNRFLGLSEAELNFLFFLLNFLAVIVIFHRFWGENAKGLIQHPILALQTAVLGFCAYYAGTWLISLVIMTIDPGFVNVNNDTLAGFTQNNRFLLTVGTILLVPPAEECLFRGLIFRQLYAKNPWLGYVLSISLFGVIHILGYLNQYTPVQLVLCFAQYLPAGLALAWSYTKSGTIFVPIAIHAVVNGLAVYSVRY